MSLRARLALFIAALVTLVATVLSGLLLNNMVNTWSSDTLERAELAAQQVQAFLVDRLMNRSEEMNAADLDAVKAFWAKTVAEDPEIRGMLERTIAYSRVIIEIGISGEQGLTLASSLPSRVGAKPPQLPDFASWRNQNLVRRLFEVLRGRQNYAVVLPMGIRQQPKPLFTIQVVVSSVLLRSVLEPQARTLALIFGGCLALSIVLAVGAANLALKPLAGIQQTIDQIAQGKFQQPAAPVRRTGEFAAVQTKLNVLGQQFRGAREDMTQLRAGIEQMLERLEEATLMFDPGGRLVVASQRCERFLGPGSRRRAGSRLEEVFPADTPLGQLIANAVREHKGVSRQPVRLAVAGAGEMEVLVSVELLEGDSHRAGALVSLRDAETRRQLASQLDVSSRLAAISRLTSGVAHELKNPLNAIALRLELLKARMAGDQPEVDGEINVIAREVTRLDRVVKTFLDFTRPVEVRMRDVDLCALTGEVASLMAPQARLQKVAIEFTPCTEPTWIRGDPDLLKQAVLNIVMNGIEAMKNGGRLDVEVQREDQQCVVAITDQGPGIPEELRHKVFQLYFTTKQRGSGIGLAMTFRAVQLHNGTIDFKSEVGKGTSFRLRFPLRGEG